MVFSTVKIFHTHKEFLLPSSFFWETPPHPDAAKEAVFGNDLRKCLLPSRFFRNLAPSSKYSPG